MGTNTGEKGRSGDASVTGGARPAKPATRKLGRGLSSLMNPGAPVEVVVGSQVTSQQRGTSPVEPPEPSRDRVLSDFESIPVDLIVPSPFQPRRAIDPVAIERLAASIRRAGVMQPVIVRPASGGGVGYELIAGERRWRAARAAGLAAVPALVRRLTDEEAAEWALVENVQREDLNAMERAWGLRGLAERFGLSAAAVAERVGLERPTVANLLRLTELEPAIAALIESGTLTAGHGRALLAVPTGPAREALARRAAEEGCSVRMMEAWAKAGPEAAAARSRGEGKGAEAASSPRFAVLRDLERQIGQQLGTKVRITTDRSGAKGKMTFEFYGIDHFDGLLARLNVRAS